MDSDDTIRADAYIQTMRRGHSGWRLTRRPFLRPTLSKMSTAAFKRNFLSVQKKKKNLSSC